MTKCTPCLIVAAAAVLLAVFGGALILYDSFRSGTPEAPGQDGGGGAFVTDSGNDDIISITAPKYGAVVGSPLVVEGVARGGWFFEATFPIVLVDWDGRIIAEHYAEATDEWMTEEYVPFRGELSFENPYPEGEDVPDFIKRGALILKKSNASGLSEHDDAIEIPIVFE